MYFLSLTSSPNLNVFILSLTAEMHHAACRGHIPAIDAELPWYPTWVVALEVGKRHKDSASFFVN